MARIASVPALTRRDDWHPRLIAVVNQWRRRPYVYGKSDCVCFVQATVAAVTGVTLLDGVDKSQGWLEAARFMIVHGWENVNDMADDIIGVTNDVLPRLSRPGDIVSLAINEEPHLGVRIGDEIVSPTGGGLEVIALWRCNRAWKIG